MEGIAWSLLSLGAVARYQGDGQRAAVLLAESRTVSEGIGFREGIAWSLEQLGLLAAGRGDPEAAALLRRSLELHRGLRDRWRTSCVLADLAALALSGGSAVRAARLLAAAAAIRAAIGTVIAHCETGQHAGTLAGARAALGDDAFDTAWRQGALAPIDDLQAEPQASAAAGTVLRIRALGAATVHRGDVPVTAADWGYAKPRELLFLLATSPPLTREQLGAPRRDGARHPALQRTSRTAARAGRRAACSGDHGAVPAPAERAVARARRLT